MMPDDLHPVKGGYEIWLAELTPVVEKMLECR
jgi:lysophospholipase L1-like esterase